MPVRTTGDRGPAQPWGSVPLTAGDPAPGPRPRACSLGRPLGAVRSLPSTRCRPLGAIRLGPGHGEPAHRTAARSLPHPMPRAEAGAAAQDSPGRPGASSGNARPAPPRSTPEPRSIEPEADSGQRRLLDADGVMRLARGAESALSARPGRPSVVGRPATEEAVREPSAGALAQLGSKARPVVEFDQVQATVARPEVGHAHAARAMGLELDA